MDFKGLNELVNGAVMYDFKPNTLQEKAEIVLIPVVKGEHFASISSCYPPNNPTNTKPSNAN